MCEVCAVFGIGEHWAEVAPHSERAFIADSIVRNRVERRRRIALLNVWLAPSQVSVSDWDGEAFAVEDQVGRRRIAADLSALWPAIDAMTCAPFDPLDEELA